MVTKYLYFGMISYKCTNFIHRSQSLTLSSALILAELFTGCIWFSLIKRQCRHTLSFTDETIRTQFK